MRMCILRNLSAELPLRRWSDSTIETFPGEQYRVVLSGLGCQETPMYRKSQVLVDNRLRGRSLRTIISAGRGCK